MRLTSVVADDLTGACDVGGELLGLGCPVRVRSAGAPGMRIPGGEALWVANTQSRAVDAAAAAARVRAAVGGRLGAGDVVLKKIDTALRGHVAVELAAALDALAPDLVLVAPAIPEVGRTTEGGRQLIGGVPVSETPFARDPLHPVTNASVLDALQAVDAAAVRAVPLAIVRDAGRYATLLATACRGRRPILVADAVSQDDLAASVAATAAAGSSLLVVGSIGVARALAAVVRPPCAARRAAPPGAAGEGVLVVCGSVHPAARGQLVATERRWGVAACEVGAGPEEDGRTVGAIVAAGGVGVLASPIRPASPRALGAALGAAVRSAIERHRPRGLVLIGGETAYHCLRALGDPPLEIEARPRPLVVAGHVATGAWRGLRVLSKGGSAGDEDAVNEMIAHAERRKPERP